MKNKEWYKKLVFLMILDVVDKLFKDLGDDFVFDRSMRNFYTHLTLRLYLEIRKLLLNFYMEICSHVKTVILLHVKRIVLDIFQDIKCLVKKIIY